MLSKKKVGLIYLERDSLYYYGSNIVNSLLKLDFTPEAVRDLDIINKDVLSKKIKLFVDTNKIQPASLIIIISPNLIFEKNFAPMEENKLETEIQKFLDNVPFEIMSTKRYTVDKSSKIIATNKLFYEIVKNSFEEKKFIIEAIIPFSALKINPAAKSNFNTTTAGLILKKFDYLKQDSLLINEENYTTFKEKGLNSEFIKNPKNKRAVILIIAFIIMTVVLLFLLIQSGIFKTKQTLKKSIQGIPVNTKSTQQTTSSVTNQPTMIPSLSPAPATQSTTEYTVSTSSSQLSRKSIKINILNSSGIAKQADFLKQRLIAQGFENIQTGNTQPTNNTTTMVIFSNTIADDIKKTIIDEVKKINIDVSVQQNSKSEFDCTIVIGKST